MAGFAANVRGAAKIKNHAAGRPAKVAIRQVVLEAMGGKSAVFDAFAGTGEMYREVWSTAGAYTGCDRDWYRDERLAYVADNRRVLRAIDLSKFDIFDLDAYGSPWEQAIIIAARREVPTGERVGFVLTDGSGLKLKLGALPGALARIANLNGRLAGLGRWQDDVIDRAIAGLAGRMRCEVERRWQAKGKTGAGVRYIGLVLRGE